MNLWATDGEIRRAAEYALGLADNNPEFLEFESALVEGDYSVLPPIELLPMSSMAGAMGAYAASTGTIYLNQDWLNSAREEQIQAVLTEELGHFLDDRLNEVDTPGDEGELFSKILNQSSSFRDEERIRAQDDQISIVVNGEEITAEAATVTSSTTYVLQAGEENLILTGTDNINGFGNDLDNFISGNNANNIIDGRDGGDSMRGLDGDDIYRVDNNNDQVVEFSGEGTDKVYSSISYILENNVEDLILNLPVLRSQTINKKSTTATVNLDINGTGNVLNNKITGNNAKNIIDGKGGADRMKGKGDDDTYYVNNKNDTVIEAADQGTDSVKSSISYALENNVENLILITCKAIDGKGNNLNNRIKGNNNKNNLKGRFGIDTLIGGLEKDTLTGGGAADKFIYNTINDSGTTSATRDVITDFAGADKINLAKIDANQVISGNQELVFIGSDWFSGAGQVRFNNGILSVNTDDDLTADMKIKPLGVTTLDETSLIL